MVSSPLTRRARRNLTYREKVAIIHKKDEEPNWTQCNLALWAKETFRLQSKPTQATISNLLRDKEKLLKAAVPPEFRSSRRVKYPELDRKMLMWVHDQLVNDVSVTRLSIQAKAIDLAQEMELPSDLTFSTGWVSSFTKRHQLDFTRKKEEIMAEQERVRQGGRILAAEAGKRAEEQQQSMQEKKQGLVTEEEGEEKEVPDNVDVALVELDDIVEVEEEEHVEKSETPPKTVDVTQDPSLKLRRVDTRNNSSCSAGEEKVHTTADVLLDWIAMSGSSSRWWLLKRDEEMEPLCDEINLFLRSHGRCELTSADIRLQLTAFVTSFQAANKWLHQAKVEYPLNVEELTSEQKCTKRHVLQLCLHYERLVTVLATYGNYDNCTVHAVQVNEALATSNGPMTTSANGDAAAVNQVCDTATVVVGTNSRRQSIEDITRDIDDETKAQKRRLFELECARLQSEIETRNIQLVLEKTLARKKLLDAGIPAEEVNRLFPL